MGSHGLPPQLFGNPRRGSKNIFTQKKSQDFLKGVSPKAWRQANHNKKEAGKQRRIYIIVVAADVVVVADLFCFISTNDLGFSLRDSSSNGRC